MKRQLFEAYKTKEKKKKKKEKIGMLGFTFHFRPD
jgi:hypothetical protein